MSGGRVCHCGGSNKSYVGQKTHRKAGGSAPLLLSANLGAGAPLLKSPMLGAGMIKSVEAPVNVPIPNTEALQKKLASLNTSRFKGKTKYANL